MKNMKQNDSGYYDETATEKGTGLDIQRGEIWEAEKANGRTVEVLTIQCFDDYAVTLTLVDRRPRHTFMNIKGREMMYVDCARLGCTYYNRLVDFVRTVPSAEMEEVLVRIAGALGVSAEVPAAIEPTFKYTADDLLLQKQLDAASTERDIYKALYEKLLAIIVPDKIGGAAV